MLHLKCHTSLGVTTRGHSMNEWAPQEVLLYRKQLLRIIHKELSQSNGIAFLLFGLEELPYSDIMDYISILPEEAVNEIITRFAGGITNDG